VTYLSARIPSSYLSRQLSHLTHNCETLDYITLHIKKKKNPLYISNRCTHTHTNTAKATLKSKKTFTIALSGGSLPKLLAKGLLAHKDKQSFEKWHVFFADERCVDLKHEDSNFRNCMDSFLASTLIPRANIHAIDASLKTPCDMAEAYEKEMRNVLGKDLSLDLVLLGMGPDGHTCSLFPNHKLLRETKRLVAHIEDSPKLPPKRITLTFPTLLRSKRIVFVTAGSSKAPILPQVLEKGSTLPSGRAVAKDGTATWFVDKDAASKLRLDGKI